MCRLSIKSGLQPPADNRMQCMHALHVYYLVGPRGCILINMHMHIYGCSHLLAPLRQLASGLLQAASIPKKAHKSLLKDKWPTTSPCSAFSCASAASCTSCDQRSDYNL